VRAKLHAVKQRASALARKPNARKAAVLTGLMYLSPALGLLLDNLLARHFGVGTTLDTFRLVTSFLMLGTGLVAGTLLKYAIIPELARAKAANDLRAGLVFVAVLAGLVLALMLPLIALGLFAPQWLLHLLGPGLPYLPEADLLVQVACVGFALMIISSAGGAVLQFYGTFWAQPVGQVALNSALVLAISLFATQAPSPAAQLQLLTYGLLAGVVGWVVIFGALLANLWRRELGEVWASTKRPAALRAIALAAMLALAPQLVIMGSEILKNILINRALTLAEPGSLTLYTFAFKMLMLASLPIMAITTIIFPGTAKSSAQGGIKMKDETRKLFYLMGISVLLAGVLWLMAPLVVKLMFIFAKLNSASVIILSEAFQVLIWVAPATALALFVTNQLYAQGQRTIILFYYILLVSLLMIMLTMPLYQGLLGICWAVLLSQLISSFIIGIFWKSKICKL
jgi:peptidoglycan biosynthesis protein MviN/MurJ (putative lipid II flippase)